METFQNFKNRKGFYNKPNQFIKNRLIEGIDNNNKPIPVFFIKTPCKYI